MQACMACARNSIVDYYYITLPLQGRHKHLASRSIHMDRIRIPPHTSPDTRVNDDDAGEDRYICVYSLVVTTAI